MSIVPGEPLDMKEFYPAFFFRRKFQSRIKADDSKERTQDSAEWKNRHLLEEREWREAKQDVADFRGDEGESQSHKKMGAYFVPAF